MSIDKLYSGISIMDKFYCRKQVLAHWYHFAGLRVENRWPDNTYRKVIKNYSKLDQNDRACSIYYVDQFFTESEIDQLEKYLFDAFGETLFIREHSVPIKTTYTRRDGQIDAFCGLDPRQLPESTFFLNTEYNNYRLPFTVMGSYCQYDGYPLDELSEDLLDSGVNFVKETFRALHVNAKISDDTLVNALKTVYDRHNYYVDWNPHKFPNMRADK